jgi:hypothetical protein
MFINTYYIDFFFQIENAEYHLEYLWIKSQKFQAPEKTRYTVIQTNILLTYRIISRTLTKLLCAACVPTITQ